MGLSTGYLIKKLGRLLALVAGTGFLFLQSLVWKGWIEVRWQNIEKDFEKSFHSGEGGFAAKLKRGMGILIYNIPFGTAFVGGFWTGYRYG